MVNKKIKMLESYVKEQLKEIDIFNDTPKTPLTQTDPQETNENSTLKKDAIGVAKEYVDLNEKLKTIKDSYEKASKTEIKSFVKQIFGDPYSNLVKMTELAYDITDKIIVKINKITGKDNQLIFMNILGELKKLLPDARKSIDELVGKYTEIQDIETTMSAEIMNENLAQELKAMLSNIKTWAIKFNYKSEYLKNKVEEIYFKMNNPKLFSK